MTEHTDADLDALEAEAIHILREVAAQCARPVLLYSMGKDSAALLHLARRAFAPAPLPFPLLHVDTTWKFRDMYRVRDRVAAEVTLHVWRNPEAVAAGINPFDHGSAHHTDAWKTQGLRQALDHHGFDGAIGGARRDEEASRAKERVLSFRGPGHVWEPKTQRPELWDLYNARVNLGESIRAFPLSNWTELDVWRYVAAHDLAIPDLYLAAPRPVVERDGLLIAVDDERMRLHPGETPVTRHVRWRTLGCYPLSGAVESRAATLAEIVAEVAAATASERLGRAIDRDGTSMEAKKREGYF